MSLGLQRGIVQLVPYNPQWAEEFESEKRALLGILGDKILGVEHVGSTAIPGIKAKPILDVMVVISSLERWEEYKEPLSTLGYEFRRDLRKTEGHVLFVKGPEENRTHYLKLAERDSVFWKNHILFRDYLSNHQEEREEYQKLKEQLLEEHKGVREPYTKGKEEFVRKILNLAKKIVTPHS